MGNLVQLAEAGKFFNVKAEKVEVLRNERAIVHFITTPDLDRGRDIVDPKGMNDEDFSKSPSVWYNHNYMFNPDALPIGKSLWRKKKEEGVLAKTQFADHAFAQDIYELHSGDFMSTWSIGWLPDKGKDAIEYDDKENILKIHKWILFEYSSAPIAMNPNAGDQIKAMKEIQWKSFFTKELIDKAETELILKEQIKSFEDRIKVLTDAQAEMQKLIEGKTGVENLTQLENKIAELQNLIEEGLKNVQAEVLKQVKEIKPEPKPENLGDLSEVIKRELPGMIAGEFRRLQGKE